MFSKVAVKELKDRIFYTILCLLVFRMGTYIPLPGVDIVVIQNIFEKTSAGMLGMFNMFSGGALGRMSIFSLAIMPYITASIVMQLMTAVFPKLGELKKAGGVEGRRKISNYTRYLTVILCCVQGYGVAVGIASGFFAQYGEAIIIDKNVFIFSSVVSLTGGTLFLMWLGEQITKNGIGNGISVIIFVGIVAEFPVAISSMMEMSRSGQMSSLVFVLFILGLIFFLAVTVFFERSYRLLPISYPRVQKMNAMYTERSNYLPIKINISGVIPPIFASALLSFPATLYSFAGGSGVFELIYSALTPGSLFYNFCYAFLIGGFAFFYNSVVFNAEEVAGNLKKSGGIVLGYRPGENTAKYLDKVTVRVTVIGVCYLLFICIVPQIFTTRYGIPVYLGGTSLLIIVGVIIELITQVQSYLYSDRYKKLV